MQLAPPAGAERIGWLTARLAELSESAPSTLIDLVDRIDLAPSTISVRIDAAIFAEKLDVLADGLDTDQLLITHPFQLRKRGVETKIVLSESPTGIDEALMRNIARAHNWLTRIRTGTSIAEIAQGEGISTSRIHQMIGLAFLAPDIVREVLDGKQPLGFTSDWCMRHTLPSDWQAQRDLLKTL